MKLANLTLGYLTFSSSRSSYVSQTYTFTRVLHIQCRMNVDTQLLNVKLSPHVFLTLLWLERQTRDDDVGKWAHHGCRVAFSPQDGGVAQSSLSGATRRVLAEVGACFNIWSSFIKMFRHIWWVIIPFDIGMNIKRICFYVFSGKKWFSRSTDCFF